MTCVRKLGKGEALETLKIAAHAKRPDFFLAKAVLPEKRVKLPC